MWLASRSLGFKVGASFKVKAKVPLHWHTKLHLETSFFRLVWRPLHNNVFGRLIEVPFPTKVENICSYQLKKGNQHLKPNSWKEVTPMSSRDSLPWALPNHASTSVSQMWVASPKATWSSGDPSLAKFSTVNLVKLRRTKIHNII